MAPQALPLTVDYAASRADFRQRASKLGALRDSYQHPLAGPDSGTLAIDVAWLGSEHAEDVIVVVSGTHGIEGFAGSALQRDLLAHAVERQPENIAVCLLHALNPHGFAHARRVNEDNIDLNRNFCPGRPPDNADYDELADLLVPQSWDEETQQSTTEALLEFAATWGFDRLQQAASGGQYTHPEGIFYGGTGPAWSNTALRDIVDRYLANRQRVAIIDLHTGLGPWGVGELISSDGPGDAAYARAVEWYGEVTSLKVGDSVSAQLSGEWLPAIDTQLSAVEVTGVALEYGTVDTVTVLQSLRADAWLHARGDLNSDQARTIKTAIRAAFADDDPAWIAALRDRFVEVFDATVSGLS